MGWHQVLLCSLVGSCRCEFVYELVYIRAVLCESTYDYRFYSTQLAQLLACCLTYPHRGNSARSALAWQGAAAEAAARFALRCQCALPASTAIARPGRSGLMPAVNRPPFFSLCVRVS